MALWSFVSLLDAEEDITKKHKDIREDNVTTRSQGTVSNDSLLLPKIRRLQRNIRKKFQDKSVADKTPEFTITSQDPKQNKTMPELNKEKVNADKYQSIKQQIEYDVVEDLKKIKANVPLFEMCKVPQQKEKLLKALETSEEERPADNQPLDEEEIGEASTGGRSKTKQPPFLLTFEIFNHNVHNFLVDSGPSINVMPISVCKKINGKFKPTTWRVVQLDRTGVIP